MIPVSRIDIVPKLRELYCNGVMGILISGGFTREGTLPVGEYVDALQEAKKNYGFVFNAHLGLQRDRNLLTHLRDVIDVVDYEFTLSSYIINYVRGLKDTYEAYIKSLDIMLDVGLHVVPHVYIWHPDFSLDILRKELLIIKDRGLREVTLLTYIPEERNIALPRPESLIEAVRFIRENYDGKLYLGCMRPAKLKPELDRSIIAEGLVERVANPYPGVLEGLRLKELYDACCSIPEMFLSRFMLQQ